MTPEDSASWPSASPPGPLAGRRIIITRSAADNRALAAALEQLGAEVVAVPLVEVLPPDDGGLALRQALVELDRYRWVVLTSANSVEAVRAALADGPWPVGVTVVPVGATTEAAARNAAMAVQAPPEVATAAALVDRFPPWDGNDNRRVLAPLAELAGSTVVEGLAAKGYLVDRVTAYRTAAPHSSPPDRDEVAAVSSADAVAFFSPSAVDRYLQRFGASAEGTPAVCIGPSTSERAAAGPFSPVVTATPHSEAGVIAALCDRL